MNQPSYKSHTDLPEYAVRRETVSSYFHPPLPSSTFYDLVNKGKIPPVKGLKGFYRPNESLKRLGLREVPHPPADAPSRSMEEILQLAFSAIDPAVFPPPSWMLFEDELTPRDKDHTRLLIEIHREAMDSFQSFEEKTAYASGVFDAQAIVEAENRSGGEQST